MKSPGFLTKSPDSRDFVKKSWNVQKNHTSKTITKNTKNSQLTCFLCISLFTKSPDFSRNPQIFHKSLDSWEFVNKSGDFIQIVKCTEKSLFKTVTKNTKKYHLKFGRNKFAPNQKVLATPMSLSRKIGEPRGVRGARTLSLMLLATFCQMPPWVVGSYRPRVTLSGTFHKQITHDKSGYRTMRGSSQSYQSYLSMQVSLEWTVSDLRWAISDLEGPLKSELRLSGLRCRHLSTRLAISDLWWAL